MTKLPILSGRRVLKVLKHNGFWVRGQKGSHIHLRHETKKPITVPDHKIISKGTLKAIIRETGKELNEFRR